MKPDNPGNQKSDNSNDSMFNSKQCNSTGIVRDSREFIPLINGINNSLQQDLGIYEKAKLLD